MARHQRPRPARGPQRRRRRDDPGPAPVARRRRSPAAAVLAALSAEPAGAAVAVIAGRAGISTAPPGRRCSRTRRPAPRPGQGQSARHRRHLEARRPGSPARRDPRHGQHPRRRQPAAEPATRPPARPPLTPPPRASRQTPAPSRGRTRPSPPRPPERRGHRPGRDEAGKALPPGTWTSPWPPWKRPGTWPPRGGGRSRPPPAAARPVTRQGRCATWSRSTCAVPRHRLHAHQVGKVLTRSAGAVANALDKLVKPRVAQMVTTSPAPTSSPPPPRTPPPRTRPATPAPARKPRPARRNARPARTARPGRQTDAAPAAPSARVPARPKPGWPAVPPGVTRSCRAGRRPLPARYIRR